LLYEAFTETSVFKEHFLRDGFFGGILDMGKHEYLMNPEKEGWFLHLHGSPLFVTREGVPKKITRAKLHEYVGENSVHIVLTNADSKPSIIENSPILSLYWKKLETLLRDAEKITLFGYGGGDKHLNQLIGINTTAKLRVVTRKEVDTQQELETRWRRRLRATQDQPLDVVEIESLLDFRDW
tara:strand:+ start:62841 stop:63386 length:546 start_codon:yes stop_codon:yes gene_type:complete